MRAASDGFSIEVLDDCARCIRVCPTRASTKNLQDKEKEQERK